ncbi:MAG TPA: hypothetical protein VEV83_21710, partial [Parafilimonas sp.]|nr:hypothetical protein [Parafilimonas sp.]
KKLYLVATMQQNLVYMAGVDLSQSFVTGGSIPVSELPSGILQVTLFDANWVAIAERITFINHQEYYFQPEVGFSQLGTGKRKQNTLVINVPDSAGANLSVAVTDAGIGTDSSDDIVSHLLLTSELRGNIYHPYYYFTDSTDTLQQQLDLVMLTNGWRRINWQDVVKGKMPTIKYKNDTDYLTLSGKLYGATPDDLKHGAFLLTILDNSDDTARRLEQLPIEPTGNFSNPDIILYDTTTAYYKLMGSETIAGSSAISFNSSMPSPATVRIDTAATVLFSDSATENYKRKLAQRQMLALKMQQGTTLAEVTVHARVKSAAQILDEKYTSPLFSSDDAYKFDALNDPLANNSQSVLEYVRGRVAGLQIVVGGGGQASARWRGGTPTFYLNEMPVTIDQLASTSMADVAYVKVFRPPFMGSIGGGASGAVAAYTRKGGDDKPKTAKGLPYKIIIGYTAEKEFYSPDYATFNNRNELDDLRTTLYWNPMVLTTKENHTIRIRFYNNDVTQSFRVVLEGMTTDGRIAHVEKVVE